MTAPELLYGLPGAEVLERDPEYVLDAVDFGAGEEVTVEEWTVAPARRHLPDVDRLLTWVIEYAGDYGEVTEEWADHAERATRDGAVRVTAEALLATIAARIGFRMADRHVADLRYRWVPATTNPEHDLGSWELVDRTVRP